MANHLTYRFYFQLCLSALFQMLFYLQTHFLHSSSCTRNCHVANSSMVLSMFHNIHKLPGRLILNTSSSCCRYRSTTSFLGTNYIWCCLDARYHRKLRKTMKSSLKSNSSRLCSARQGNLTNWPTFYEVPAAMHKTHTIVHTRLHIYSPTPRFEWLVNNRLLSIPIFVVVHSP